MAEPKKETVRIALPPRPEQPPDSQSVAKRDTARIVLPARTPPAPVRRSPPSFVPSPAASSAPAAEPAVISLRRPPLSPPLTSATSPLLQPLPKPPGPIATPDAPATPPADPIAIGENGNASTSQPTPPLQPGPKQETARIRILPKPGAVNMTKTQPLLVRPAATVQAAPVILTSKPVNPFASIPRSYCWGLFGISAFIFLIQIWNYFVS
ncbi:MAG: hypothetical protein DLM73_09505 [Chthoniobacterales bacterium]|nr:MAG: hypothetical protein DLM73_09505 [Chthoniobacterales bacterium]